MKSCENENRLDVRDVFPIRYSRIIGCSLFLQTVHADWQHMKVHESTDISTVKSNERLASVGSLKPHVHDLAVKRNLTVMIDGMHLI